MYPAFVPKKEVSYEGIYECQTADMTMRLGEGGITSKQTAMSEILKDLNALYDRQINHADNIICRTPVVAGKEKSAVFISCLGGG